MTTQEIAEVEKGWNGLYGPCCNIQHRMKGDAEWEHCPYPRFFVMEALEFRVTPLAELPAGSGKSSAVADEINKRNVIEKAYNGLEGSESNIEFKFDNEPETAWTAVTPKWNWVWCNYRIKQT